LDKINKWTANYFLYIVFFFLDQPKTWHQKAQNESRAESDLESSKNSHASRVLQKRACLKLAQPMNSFNQTIYIYLMKEVQLVFFVFFIFILKVSKQD
jgi:hypothetical protein